MVKLVLVGRAKKPAKIENFGLKVCSLGPRGNPHMRPRGNLYGPRGNPQSDLEATRTDLEDTRNDRKQAMPHPRKERGRSLWSDILICFLGCGTARFLSSRVALRSVGVASRSDRGLPQGPIPGCLEVSCAGRLEVPGNKLWNQNFQFYVFFWPFQPKRPLPHPISIQNMRFGR